MVSQVAMRVEDYFANGKRWWVRLHELGERVDDRLPGLWFTGGGRPARRAPDA
jgi:hypothetical protein